MSRTLSARSPLQFEITFDAYLEELDAVDAALGAHLLEAALTPGASADARRGSPDWWRSQVRRWCALPSTAACFDAEAVGSAAMAAEQMEDVLLMPWVRSLLTAGADLLPRRPAA
jgi:hypothetical protein